MTRMLIIYADIRAASQLHEQYDDLDYGFVLSRLSGGVT